MMYVHEQLIESWEDKVAKLLTDVEILNDCNPDSDNTKEAVKLLNLEAKTLLNCALELRHSYDGINAIGP